jgi:cellobiose transport system permease protein
MLALFTFVTTWTTFFWRFIVLPPSNPTLPVALQSLQAGYFINYSLVLAGVSLATIPLLVLFIAAGRQLVSGIMEGAVKGLYDSAVRARKGCASRVQGWSRRETARKLHN